MIVLQPVVAGLGRLRPCLDRKIRQRGNHEADMQPARAVFHADIIWAY
jgi:hypothetical protein